MSTLHIDAQRFAEQGYLVVEDVLDAAADLDPVVTEYTELLDTLAAQWQAEGTITSRYEELPFAERMALMLNERGWEGVQSFDISLPLSGVTAESPIHLGPAVFALLSNPRLVDAIEQLIGPEILSNPIQHVRIKPPVRLLNAEIQKSLAGNTDWQQDQAVALPEVDETEMLTVWLPVTAATEENGCMCVVPGSHCQGMVTHCPGNEARPQVHIPDELRGTDYVPLPMPRGSVLFLHRRTMHGALSNRGRGVRWSFDLRYQPIGHPTGRPWFPAFVVRGRQHPEQEVRDWHVWANLWYTARSRLAQNGMGESTNRWAGAEIVCA